MKVFIIVLNWNQPKLTLECVSSLHKLKLDKDLEIKIVIVDNGSTDNSTEKFANLKNIDLIPTGKNLGFAGGNNVGIKYAIEKHADYVLVLNNDTEVDSQLLTHLVKTAENNTKIAAVTPKIYFAKGFEFHKDKYTKHQLGKVIWSAGGKIDWNNIIGKNIGVDEVDNKQFEKNKEVDFATGACVLYSTEALKETGMFDEKYFMYMEDMELSERLKRKGYKIMYEPKGIIYHKVAQSSGIGSGLNDYFISRNRLLFGFKYAKFRTKLALFRESLRLFITGRHWQAVGIRDFYLRKFGKGSFE